MRRAPIVSGYATERDSGPPSISGAWFQYIVRCLESLGVPVDAICRDLGIDLEAVVDPDLRVDRDTATLLWREAERRSADPLLGLHAARHFRLGFNNVIAHLIVSCETLAEAVSALQRYQTLVAAGTVVSLERREETVAIVVAPVEGRLPLLRHQTEFIVGAIAQIIRALTDPPAAVLRVHFRHQCPGNALAFEDFFGCRVQFRAGENSLVLSSVTLKQPVRDRAPGIARRLKALAEEDLQTLAGTSVSQRVELALWRRLRARQSTRMCLEDVAAELHLSTRSLQRRLAEESQTFAVLLDQVRRDFAQVQLEAGVPRAEIASRLGFARTTTLSQALRRWAGS